MDPNENLKQQLEFANDTLAGSIGTESLNWEWRATRLAELAIALDEWIRKGGFLPAAWESARWNTEHKHNQPTACSMCDHTPCTCT